LILGIGGRRRWSCFCGRCRDQLLDERKLPFQEDRAIRPALRLVRVVLRLLLGSLQLSFELRAALLEDADGGRWGWRGGLG